MSVPSMVHRSGDSLIVRSVVSGNRLYGSADVAAEDDNSSNSNNNSEEDDETAATPKTTSLRLRQRRRQQSKQHHHQPEEEDEEEGGYNSSGILNSDGGEGGGVEELPDCKVKRNYSCANCDYFTQNPRLYLYHLRDVHKEKVKIYKCPNCLYASKHFQKLLRHTKMVHGTSDGIEPMTASTGNATSRRGCTTRKRSAAPPVEEEEVPGDMQQQQQSQAPPQVKCSVCAFTSRNQAQLARHEREEHIKTRFFRCTKCTYVTHIKARFTKHVKYHSMPMIKCDMCDFRTPYKWNLDRHCKNHNGNGAFRCSACNFTADIKQSLTVHEMNHHVPPVGQAAGLGVGRRRNKVGASDATAAEEAAAASATTTAAIATQQQIKQQTNQQQITTAQLTPSVTISNAVVKLEDEDVRTRSKSTPLLSSNRNSSYPLSTSLLSTSSSKNFGSDFINPDDIVSHSNGKFYVKSKCKLCNFKSAWDGEMAKHEKKVHNIMRPEDNNLSQQQQPSAPPAVKVVKKTPKPIPNLIPIQQSQTSLLKMNNNNNNNNNSKKMDLSEKDIDDICAKSKNSVLKDFASLFNAEDVFKTCSKVPDLIATPKMNETNSQSVPQTMEINPKGTESLFKKKNASFFDKLKEKLELNGGQTTSLTCKNCGYESRALTEHSRHQKICGQNNRPKHVMPNFNISSSRCQYCRQRCKSSTDLYNHLQTCEVFHSQTIKEEKEDTLSENELKIDEDLPQQDDEAKPHPMENRVFVWNNFESPMAVDEFDYHEDKIDDAASLDMSIRTQSPGGSESSYLGQEYQPIPVASSASSDKIPTHGNDISVAQHKRVFKCPNCTFWASTASRFHVHIVGHLNKKPFECSLCSYRSNWRWDITKHIKLKSVRDPAHEQAKVLMTDETGRRNYTKYNKYLTEIPVTGEQSMETSGGNGTRPKNHDRNNSPSTSRQQQQDLPKLSRAPSSTDFSPLLRSSPLRAPPPLRPATEGQMFTRERKRPHSDSKKTMFRCKKCKFGDVSRDVLLEHVKIHYQSYLDPLTAYNNNNNKNDNNNSISSNNNNNSDVSTAAAAAATLQQQDISLRGTSPDKDEASVNSAAAKGGGGGIPYAPFRCGHCNQVSNWKHVIQRHCRLKHNGDVRVVTTKNGQEKIEVEDQSGECDVLDCSSTTSTTNQSQDGTFKCILCPFASDSCTDFQNHITGHNSSSDMPFKCPYCTFYAGNKEELVDHCKLHEPSNDFEEVDRTSSSNSVASDDLSSKKFRCAVCPYVTNSKSQYTYHVQFHETKSGQYTCTECSYNVTKKHLLHQHLKVHGIFINPSKSQNTGQEFDDLNEDIEEVPSSEVVTCNLQTQHLPDIPLVWVYRQNKFSKMYKCRYCPHVNLRKVNIQEHEKMHSLREKTNASGSSRNNDIEHRCNECNYVCNNAGVLSSHSKVHQGNYGLVYRLVDPVKADEDQIKEMSQELNLKSVDLETELTNEDAATSATYLYFCNECPARFLRKNEMDIHKNFHGSRLFYKCDHCSYAVRENAYLIAHGQVHTTEYQNRTRNLQNQYSVHQTFPQPKLQLGGADNVWTVQEDDFDSSFQMRKNFTIPLSGTDLFLQKSEAQALLKESKDKDTFPAIMTQVTAPTATSQMAGNPNFIYPTYLKNGRMKEKRYKCMKCPSAFEKREQYKVHLSLHGSNQRYSCKHCDYSVKYYANYVQHEKKHQQNLDALAARGIAPPDEVMAEETEAEKSLAEIQASQIEQKAGNVKETSGSSDEKKPFWCPLCPYTNQRRDAVENHQRRHYSISGVRSAYSCDHCDYSVPQAHFLRDHTKLHFTSNKINQVDGFMDCKRIKLTRTSDSNDEDDEEEGENNEKEEVIFEEQENDDGELRNFYPPLKSDVLERFNNNEGEKMFVNTQTGELVSKIEDDSDNKSSIIKDEEKAT